MAREMTDKLKTSKLGFDAKDGFGDAKREP